MIEELNRRGGTNILFRKIQTNTCRRNEGKENHRWILKLEDKSRAWVFKYPQKYLPQNNYCGGLNICPQIFLMFFLPGNGAYVKPLCIWTKFSDSFLTTIERKIASF